MEISCARDVLSMDCGRMSNEAEYMNLDVENKTSKVETCIVDLFIKAAENRQFECEKQKVPCTIEKFNHEVNTVGCRIA